MRRSYEAGILGAKQSRIAETLATVDGHVRLTIDTDQRPQRLNALEIAEGATLDISFPRSDGIDSSWSVTATRSMTSVPATITIDGPRRVSVYAPTSLIGLRLVVNHAEAQFSSAAEIVRVEARNGSISRASIGRNILNISNGDCSIEVRDQHVDVTECRNASISGGDDAMVLRIRRMERCKLADVSLIVDRQGVVQTCSGNAWLHDCRGGHIVCKRGALKLAIPADTGVDNPLDQAVLRDFALDGESLPQLLRAVDAARVFTPWPASIPEALAELEPHDRLTTAEHLHDVLTTTALAPAAVEVAGEQVLRSRLAIDNWRHPMWWLLGAHGLLGFGRSLAKPVAVFGFFVVLILAHRAGLALARGSGYLHLVAGHPKLDVSWASLVRAGDIGLSTALLPVNWSPRGEPLGDTVGLTGGYLVAARLLLAMPILAGIAAGRRMLRVRQAHD